MILFCTCEEEDVDKAVDDIPGQQQQQQQQQQLTVIVSPAVTADRELMCLLEYK